MSDQLFCLASTRPPPFLGPVTAVGQTRRVGTSARSHPGSAPQRCDTASGSCPRTIVAQKRAPCTGSGACKTLGEARRGLQPHPSEPESSKPTSPPSRIGSTRHDAEQRDEPYLLLRSMPRLKSSKQHMLPQLPGQRPTAYPPCPRSQGLRPAIWG